MSGQSTNQEYTNVQEDKPDHHWRTETPNIIYDLGLCPGERDLYGYYKKVAGDGGYCDTSNSTIQKALNISPNTIKKYRNSLATKKHELLGNKSLITSVEGRFRPEGDPDTVYVQIVNIWRENGDNERNKIKERIKKQNRGTSKVAGGVPQNLMGGTSKFAHKEEPLKKNLKEEQQQGQSDHKQEEAKPSASLVVVSLLKSLGISKTMQDRVLVKGKYPETQILAACEVLKQAGCNVTNPDAYLQSALNNKHWELKEEVVDEAEERRNENKAKAMLVLATLTDKDVKGGGTFSFDGKIVNINSRERGDFSIDTSKEITKYKFGKSPTFMIIKALGCNPFW